MTGTRMTCRELVEFLMDYLDDALPADVRAQLEIHMSCCPNCVRYVETYRTTTTLTRIAFEVCDDDPAADVPEELVQAILNARPQ